jgi:hypothetical protein
MRDRPSMTPIEKLEYLNTTIAMAVQLIGEQRETIEAFQKESLNMDNFGHIVDPTLYKNTERRIMSEVLGPIYDAALNLVKVYGAQTAQMKDALAKVNANG